MGRFSADGRVVFIVSHNVLLDSTEVLCADATAGTVLWRKPVTGLDSPRHMLVSDDGAQLTILSRQPDSRVWKIFTFDAHSGAGPSLQQARNRSITVAWNGRYLIQFADHYKEKTERIPIETQDKIRIIIGSNSLQELQGFDAPDYPEYLPGPVASISHDGSLLATEMATTIWDDFEETVLSRYHFYHFVTVWRVKDGKELAVIKVKGSVQRLQFSADSSSLLAMVDSDHGGRTLYRWNASAWSNENLPWRNSARRVPWREAEELTWWKVPLAKSIGE